MIIDYRRNACSEAWNLTARGTLRVVTFFKDHITTSILLVAFTVYLISQHISEKRSQVVFADPKRNDFLFVDYFKINDESDARHRYIALKVVNIDESGIQFKVGNIAHSQPVSPRTHVKFDAAMQRKFFRADTLTLTKDELDGFIASGVVYAARRPKNVYIDGWIVIPQHEINTSDL